MRIKCPYCFSKLIITSTERIENTAIDMDMYCVCSNTRYCGASFVYALEFRHYLKKPKPMALKAAKQAIDKLSTEQKAAFLKEMPD